MTTIPANPSTLSALTSLTSSSSTHAPHYHHLATQILHNLRFQHDWTVLRIHTHSPLSSTSSPQLLPRPLISGCPPQRIYVHPDEQVEMLKAGVKEDDVPVEREWVLPTHLREKWSLRRFAEVFDAVGETPPGEEGGKSQSTNKQGDKRRGGKRLLLATVSDDSTVVYYIVHDGIVKPRQN